MLIMPTTSIDFKTLADNITREFYESGTPLEEGVVKVAKERELNPEEVSRLVEKTNTAASLWLLKTSEHKKDSFALADTQRVLGRTHFTQSNDSVKSASVYAGLPIKTAPKDNSLLCKVAHTPSEHTKDLRTTQKIFILNKYLADKQLVKVATESKVQDKIDYLASEFSSWNSPSFEKFAGDCRSLFGAECEPVISGLATYLGVPSDSLSKCASDAYIDDTDARIVAMGDVCAGLNAIVKLAGEVLEIETAIKRAWVQARAGA